MEILSDLYDDLEFLISSANDEKTAKEKKEIIEKISARIIEELSKNGLTKISSADLERHAYCVNDKVKDPEIRNLNILYAV